MTIQKGKMKNLGIPDVQSANPGAQKAYVPTPWPDGQHPCTKEPAKTSGTWGAHGCPCSSVVPPGNSLWVSRSIAFDHSSLRKSLKTPIFCCLKTCDSLIFWAVSPIFIPQLQHSALASLIDWPGDKNAELVQHTTRTWLVTGIPWGNGTGTRKITSHEIWKDDSMTMAWFVIITSLLKWVSLQGSGPVGYQLPKNWVNQVLFGAPPEDFLGGTPGFHPSATVGNFDGCSSFFYPKMISKLMDKIIWNFQILGCPFSNKPRTQLSRLATTKNQVSHGRGCKTSPTSASVAGGHCILWLKRIGLQHQKLVSFGNFIWENAGWKLQGSHLLWPWSCVVTGPASRAYFWSAKKGQVTQPTDFLSSGQSGQDLGLRFQSNQSLSKTNPIPVGEPLEDLSRAPASAEDAE